MRVRSVLAFAVVAVCAVGCVRKESIDSADITTHGTSLELDARSDGTNTKVTVAVHVGSWESHTYARLSSGDRLILTDPKGDKHTLPVIRSGDLTSYGIDLPVTAGSFSLDFVREKGISALGNTVALPAGFTVAAPAEKSRKEPLTFTWDPGPGGYAMTYSLTGECILDDLSETITGDPGTFTINAGTIKTHSGDTDKTCPVTLRVTRTLASQACCSAEFGHPSRARGIQERVVTFTSKP